MVDTSKAGGHFQSVFFFILATVSSTGGRMSQHAAKRTRGFPHLRERNTFFLSNWSLLKEKEFLSRTSKSVFQACSVFFWQLLLLD